MKQAEIIFHIDSPSEKKLYKELFFPDEDFLFHYCNRTNAIERIGGKIIEDLRAKNLTHYVIDSGEKETNKSLKDFFSKEKQNTLKEQEIPLYNWNKNSGSLVALIVGFCAFGYTYFGFSADWARDTANYLNNNFPAGLSFPTGITQAGISIIPPIASGAISTFLSNGLINSAGKIYCSLKNKLPKAKKHTNDLRKKADFLSELERAVV